MPSLTLNHLCQRLSLEVPNGLSAEARFNSVSCSAQEVKAGAIFVAIKGVQYDGHDFIDLAVKNGASLVIASDREKARGVPALFVDDTRLTLSRIASALYEDPSKKLRLIGVTGTNGKTTTNWMVYNLLLRLGKAAARFGTLGFELRSGEFVTGREGNLTTPDTVSIQKDLYQSVSSGAEAAVLEVSSHALDQRRADSLHFDNIIYTNLTRDHLDYHADMESYFKAKARILDLLKESCKEDKYAVLNLECEFGRRLYELAEKKGVSCLTYAFSNKADLKVKEFKQDIEGTKAELEFRGERFHVTSRFIGKHNVENLMAALLSCFALGYDFAKISALTDAIPQVPGRLESVTNGEIGVFVDYAHTPDALENVLKALLPLKQRELWVVFGCGGDRDRGKRPEMAAIASKYADKVAVTSDNPRTEDPLRIIEDILSQGVRPFLVEPDRRLAIKNVIRTAKKGDIVLIAGKGHENYQIIGTEKHHFSDVEEVERAFSL